MSNTQTLSNSWSEIKSQIQNKWKSLTDQELNSTSGNVQLLVETIQKKTGDAKEGIEHFFDELGDRSSGALNRVNIGLHHGAERVAEAYQDTKNRVTNSAREGYDEVAGLVKRNPAESALTLFGVGVLTGVVASYLLRSK